MAVTISKLPKLRVLAKQPKPLRLVEADIPKLETSSDVKLQKPGRGVSMVIQHQLILRQCSGTGFVVDDT